MTDHAALLHVVRSVRNRWRLKVLLRGLGIVLFLGTALLVFAGYAVDASRFDAVTVTSVRVLAYLGLAVMLLWFLARPLARRVSDERAALYLEEHEPTLGGQLISALELGRQPERSASPALVERLIRSAIKACHEVEGGRRVERAGLWRSASMVAGSTALGLGLFLTGPAFIHHTTPLLLDPWLDSGTVNPYRLLVEPGDATVARGADLKVTATLDGFDATAAELVVGNQGGWRRWPMLHEAGIHNLIIFELKETTEYFVEARGVRSPTYRIEVMELPYVEDIHLTYRFPAYTGLEPLEQAGSGDIAALKGTVVEIEVTPTLPVNRGAIELEIDHGSDEVSSTLPLTRVAGDTDGERLVGSFTVGQPGRYRILLGDRPSGGGPTKHRPEAGPKHVASPDYLIDPLSDQPPSVQIAKPGRDIQASNLEEVAIEVRAQDDYGVGRLELVYAVNGGPERTARLYRGRPGRKDLTGSHTLFLEELGESTGRLLQPGDLVSYYARAFDAAHDASPSPARETASDIYFLEIRPFDRNYRQADQAGPGGGQGMSGAELTAQQRLIVAATFKLSRGQPKSEGDSGDIATVALSQGRLREQVEALIERLEERSFMTADAIDADSPAAVMIELLPQATTEMAAAEEALGSFRPGQALAPEQRALQLLQRAEAAFTDVQVTEGQQGGGGGDIRDELNDLFEQERDRLRNQYEQVQRGERQRRDDAIDETLEKLRELARRQQQENERMRARARQADRDARAGSSGRSQRQLAEETEDVARRLERLARQQSLPDLAETARRLRQAVEEMRRASAAGERAGESLADSALERLHEARKQLERGKSGRLERDTRQAIEQTRRLRQQQRRVVDRVDQLDPGDDEALSAIHQTKEAMATEVGELEAALDQLSRDARRDQPEASRRLTEAAGAIRDGKIREKILYSRGVVQQRSKNYARNFEQHIGGTLDELAQRLTAAAGAIGDSPEQRLDRALDETREAVTALESLEERLRADGQGRPGAAGDTPAGGEEMPQPRQLRRELGQRTAQLEQLGGGLRDEGVETTDLDRIISRLRELGRDGTGPKVLAALEDDIVRGLKEFEFALRRSLLADDSSRVLQADDNDVPDGFEEMVDRYYKALAEGRR